MKSQLMIPAAGMGTRLGCAGPKALVELAGKPMLAHTLQRFQPVGLVSRAVIVVVPGFRRGFNQALEATFPNVRFTLVDGGEKRQTSVSSGLDALDPDTDIVVIHDAARPFVARASIEQSLEAAAECGAATVAVPSVDTMLEADEQLYLNSTLDRERLWACQTPQTFQVEVIREAHKSARREQFVGTDDASLVRRLGGKVKLVPGTPLNFKVTTPTDLALAECVVRRRLA